MFLYLFIFVAAAISCYECGSMYDGTNFMGIKGYDQCQFFESDVILGASGEEKEPDIRTKGGFHIQDVHETLGFSILPLPLSAKKLMYRVTHQVSNYILLSLIWEFNHVAYMPCQFCQICSCPSRVKQISKLQNQVNKM